MMTSRVFDEIVDFITSTPQPEQILMFRPSVLVQNQLEDLLEKKRGQRSMKQKRMNLTNFY